MHQYRTITQTLLVLSILNHVIAAPAIPQEVRDRDAGSNAAAVAPEDVATVSERRRGFLPPPDVTTGTTPSQLRPSLQDGSPPQDSLPLDRSASLQGSQSSNEWAPSSATDGQLSRTPTSTHPLSAAVGPGPDSTAEASTSAYPLSEGSGSAPVHGSNTAASASSHQLVPVHGPASTTSQYTAITPDMLHKDPNARPLSHTIAGFALFATVVTGIVLLSVLQKNHNSTGNSTVHGG